MIHYQLKCCDEHSFDGWFRDSAAYEKQSASGDIECPYCGKTEITKAPMAPSIGKAADDADALTTEAPITEVSTTEARAQKVAQKILEAATKAREYVEENFENVGDDFADEARAMHNGEREEGGIYGNATDTEEKELEEDGVDFVRIPANGSKNN
ncbi:MAG: DUF1178 family protein [Rhodospirillaceae bacterium]|nr:DUF1178 family protein [Rhodospirillaceae bacterium]